MITTAKRLHIVEEYYFSSKLREVRQLASEGKPIINMGIGSPDLSPPQNVIDAIVGAMRDDNAHQYQSYQGLPELRQGVADFYLNNYGVAVNPLTEILPLMGSKEGIMHISMAFLNEGDEVLIPNPGYPTYTSVTNLVGAIPVYYDLTANSNWEPDFEALEKLDLSKVKLMWIGYPHMPTGSRGNLVLFEKLVAFAQRHQILLVNDNPYSFVLNDNPMSLLQVKGAVDVALELNSLSKTFNMAGWRVGMVVGNAACIDAVLKVKSNMDSGMFYPVQKGAIAALKSDKSWFQGMNLIYKRRRGLTEQLAEKLGCQVYKEGVGLFVWAKLPEGIASAEAFINDILYQKHLFITPGTIFGSNGEGYIRFALCVKEEKIQEAIDRFLP
ncbi:aminotransferase class I/II-fold pyridoxal phosphate-dependent enzyme [Flavobacterium sp. F-380]|uniref:Aminotransferase n=1 Tax=Flavobacterium kayseriense TaxID=2764714 RepID=A0ABR7J641_9FLAO|nr:aminotransferase class I/II-fold pyridoxal phosphate-dependent enzyme [Flavobacterium kayseriense]MBC5840993.1 aminotransferase class I/II-fold pyridoxal phosphate-dependent enzyme [Flavobacterium kayseriense]MBC5846338.1 aminotransferase class I/II-fold pyridoxal phosphate-dependent enzyme [Flavobacterium kayseriense]MBU0940654.1 aminotransferase class I/II-fold pyridoxal phosphate-dependent enzyme [Bacteroidota bacterium]